MSAWNTSNFIPQTNRWILYRYPGDKGWIYSTKFWDDACSFTKDSQVQWQYIEE